MMKHSTCISSMLLAGSLAGSMLSVSAQTAQTNQPGPSAKPPVSSQIKPSQVQVASAVRPESEANLAAVRNSGWHAREGAYYKRNWGVDIVDVRRVASGEMLAFRYVIIDPEKAKVLNDKRNPASLTDEKTGTKLLVPQMEKIGALRTTMTAAAGRMYWIVFANTGHLIKDGSIVDVNIGDFHAEGLTVISK